MRIELTSDQAAGLVSLLRRELRELTGEMAASTDSRRREELSLRHDLLDGVVQAIGTAEGLGAGESSPLEREMAHPGD